MAAVELALKQLDAPEVDGVTYDEVIEAGEHLPGMAALWDVATVEERYEMVTIVLEPGGLYYDLENKIIAAIKPRPAFLPVLRMLNGVMEFDETRGLLVAEHWCERNRRVSVPLSPIFPSSLPRQESCITRCNACEASEETAGTAIGYGGEFNQPLQTHFRLVFPSFDCTNRLLHSVGSCSSFAFIFTEAPTAVSKGVFSLHSRSHFSAWHQRQRRTEHFLHCPPSVGSSCGSVAESAVI